MGWTGDGVRTSVEEVRQTCESLFEAIDDRCRLSRSSRRAVDMTVDSVHRRRESSLLSELDELHRFIDFLPDPWRSTRTGLFLVEPDYDGFTGPRADTAGYDRERHGFGG